MWRVGLFGRRSVVAASTACVGFTSHCEQPQGPPNATVSLPLQWLWTIDGVQVRRDGNGKVVYMEEASGKVLPGRPASVPPEAYANRWRSHSKISDVKKHRTARHLLLVRHGQYAIEEKRDDARVLTPVGKQQADICARRLLSIHEAATSFYEKCSLASLTSSTLTRAVQTADIISPLLPNATRKALPLLNEGRPCLPEPYGPRADRYDNRHHDAERIEAAVCHCLSVLSTSAPLPLSPLPLPSHPKYTHSLAR